MPEFLQDAGLPLWLLVAGLVLKETVPLLRLLFLRKSTTIINTVGSDSGDTDSHDQLHDIQHLCENTNKVVNKSDGDDGGLLIYTRKSLTKAINQLNETQVKQHDLQLEIKQLLNNQNSLMRRMCDHFDLQALRRERERAISDRGPIGIARETDLSSVKRAVGE